MSPWWPLLRLLSCCPVFNTLRPRQNGRHFPDDSFKYILLQENVSTSLKISLKCVPKGSINNIPALVQIMAWCRSGNKPLSEPMVVSLPTHICVTRPQWVNLSLWNSFEDLWPVDFSELQRLDYMTEYQDSSPSNGCQLGDMPHCTITYITLWTPVDYP